MHHDLAEREAQQMHGEQRVLGLQVEQGGRDLLAQAGADGGRGVPEAEPGLTNHAPAASASIRADTES